MFHLTPPDNFTELPPLALLEKGCDIMSPFLRQYQLNAVHESIKATLRTTEPLLLEVPTGGGKSWICVGMAFLMKYLFARAGHENRKTLIICPSGPLVEQNAEKLKRCQANVSIFCATLQIKETHGDIIVASPLSVGNALDLFATLNIGCLIVDEAHENAKTGKLIAQALRKVNPYLREFGMTATPYRTKEKYIYKRNTYDDLPENPPHLAIDPHYGELIYRIMGDQLVEAGYLAHMVIVPTNYHYTTSLLKMNGDKFTTESERRVFISEQQNNVILDDMLKLTRDCKSVMIFCQNILHANQIAELLDKKSRRPNGERIKKIGRIGMIHSGCDEKQSRTDRNDFGAGKIKYLISVRSMTTGYDNERVDGIVTLSSTESPGLYGQITGRGRRLPHDDRRLKKTHCKLFDYGENVLTHFPDGDLFNPKILPVGEPRSATRPLLTATCPRCQTPNISMETKWVEPLALAGFTPDPYGYFVDQKGQHLCCTLSLQPVAAFHQGRCQGLVQAGQDPDAMSRCSHRWHHRLCDACGVLNGASDSVCRECQSPLTEQRNKEERAPFFSGQTEREETEESPVLQHYVLQRGRVVNDTIELRLKRKNDQAYLQAKVDLDVVLPPRPRFTPEGIVIEPKKTLSFPLYFDDGPFASPKSLQRKQLLIKALYGEDLPLEALKTRLPTHKLTKIDFFSTASSQGAVFYDCLDVKSRLIQVEGPASLSHHGSDSQVGEPQSTVVMT